MKNLLVITLLFSTTAFTNIYLACDAPYVFFPDLDERVLFKLDKTQSKVIRTELIFDRVKEIKYEDLHVTDSSYLWLKNKWGAENYNYEIDRYTSTFKDFLGKRDWKLEPNLTLECKNINDKSDYLDAINDLEKEAKKIKDNRKI